VEFHTKRKLGINWIYSLYVAICCENGLSACFLNLNNLILPLKNVTTSIVPPPLSTRPLALSSKTLVSIYEELIPGKNDLDQSSLLDSSNTYAISRTWVTSFKAYVEKRVNSLKKLSNEEKNSNCGGIDILDLSVAMRSQDSGAICFSDGNENVDPFKGENPTSKITCELFHSVVATVRHFCEPFIINVYCNLNLTIRQA
jgi:hypothetical protein